MRAAPGQECQGLGREQSRGGVPEEQSHLKDQQHGPRSAEPLMPGEGPGSRPDGTYLSKSVKRLTLKVCCLSSL